MFSNFIKKIFHKEPTHKEILDAYIDLYNLNLADPPLRIYDVTDLPFSKKLILGVFLKELANETNPVFINALTAGILYLANFQENVGKVPIDRALPDHLYKHLLSDRTLDNAKKIAGEIVAFNEKNKAQLDKFVPIVEAERDRLCHAIYAVTGTHHPSSGE